MTGRILGPEELDAREDAGKSLECWLGRRVAMHWGPIGVLVRRTTRQRDSKRWGKTWTWYAVRCRVICHRRGCRKGRIVYAVSGLHSGAYCYLRDPRTGEFVANMRDQVFACASHKRA